MTVVHSSKMNFEEVVNEYFHRNYKPEVVETVYEVVHEVSKEAVKKLRKESPRDKGDYAKGWARKQEMGRTRVIDTIYGKSGTYQLAHLLEHGHANRGGGRTKAVPHIAKVDQWAQDEVYERLMDRLEALP